MWRQNKWRKQVGNKPPIGKVQRSGENNSKSITGVLGQFEIKMEKKIKQLLPLNKEKSQLQLNCRFLCET